MWISANLSWTRKGYGVRTCRGRVAFAAAPLKPPAHSSHSPESTHGQAFRTLNNARITGIALVMQGQETPEGSARRRMRCLSWLLLREAGNTAGSLFFFT